jgi:hypothetical protein
VELIALYSILNVLPKLFGIGRQALLWQIVDDEGVFGIPKGGFA